PAVRERELQEFAARQTPALEALEEGAEQLRRTLVRGGLLQSSVDWNHDRTWTPTGELVTRDGAVKDAEFQVLRAAAYYEDGFAPAQRGLLLELAHDLRRQARAELLRRPPAT